MVSSAGTYDCVVVGGGVVGLSSAWELAGTGLKVAVLDQAVPGRESSWAGAGMLPPGNLAHARTGDSVGIVGYLGTSERFGEVIADWAEAYADQTERDHAALVDALERGVLPSVSG